MHLDLNLATGDPFTVYTGALKAIKAQLLAKNLTLNHNASHAHSPILIMKDPFLDTG